MVVLTTEKPHPEAPGLDARPDYQILISLLRGQQAALSDAVFGPALPQIERGAGLMAQAIREGGRLIYAAAGSSGVMALSDAAELGGTFGIPSAQITILMAGGVPVDASMPGETEDDIPDPQALAIMPGDVAIAITASGATPYPLAIAQAARQRGARVIAIASNADAPVFDLADVAICLAVQPEIIAGSTRMGAGTAQKSALNMMSTLMGIRLGHVHDGLMVNMLPENRKLRQRAAMVVACIADVDLDQARSALEASDYVIKPAVLLALGAASPVEALRLVEEYQGQLRPAMARLGQGSNGGCYPTRNKTQSGTIKGE